MRYFNTSRLLRKRREWLKKPYITAYQLAHMRKPLDREVYYWMVQQKWRYSQELMAWFNPRFAT